MQCIAMWRPIGEYDGNTHKRIESLIEIVYGNYNDDSNGDDDYGDYDDDEMTMIKQ